MNGSFTVTFWGVRGSHPAPGAQTVGVGGNTTSVEVRAGNHVVILDAGTGVIGLGRALVSQHRADKKPITANVFFTHTHHDHTQGFPFFVPLYFKTTTLYIFGPKSLHEDLEVLARAMVPPVFPIGLGELPCLRVVRNLLESEVVVLDANGEEPRVFAEHREPLPESPQAVFVRVMRSYAHPHWLLVYRIEYDGKAMVMATDTEGYVGGDQRLIRFVRGADLLLHDAQYTEAEYASPVAPTQGWGHSTWQMAVEVARAARVQRLALVHHDPAHDDAMLERLEQEAQAAFPQAFLAREGMKIEL